MDVYLHAFLISLLDGDEWSASHPGRFIPGEIYPTDHWTGDWVGARTGMDAVEKRRNPGDQTPVVQPLLTELPWLKI
jgi:hypothetical protein